MHEDRTNAATAAYLDSLEGTDAARLTFMAGLWEIQREESAAAGPYDPPAADEARDAIVRGESLFQSHAPVISSEAFLEVLSRIVEYVATDAGLPGEQTSALRATDFARVVTDEALAKAATSPEGLASSVAELLEVTDESALTRATLSFVLLSALVPFLIGPSAQAMEALGELDRATWPSGRCPVCGAPAAMGRVGESTALQGADRTLWCGMCHAEWAYDRIRCVRCGTRTPGNLHYSHVEEDPVHRIHLCDECHGYAKFVFEGELRKPLSMVVEDAVTTVLEEVALKNGYTATGDGGRTSC